MAIVEESEQEQHDAEHQEAEDSEERVQLPDVDDDDASHGRTQDDESEDAAGTLSQCEPGPKHGQGEERPGNGDEKAVRDGGENAMQHDPGAGNGDRAKQRLDIVVERRGSEDAVFADLLRRGDQRESENVGRMT